MTPEDFLKRNPNWRDNAAEMIASVVTFMTRDGKIPSPWTDDIVLAIEAVATQEALGVFAPLRDQMGDDVFGELVLLIGHEAKRCAELARNGKPVRSQRLQ